MPLIRPFAALRPRPEHAAEIAAPPYDVLDSDEARQRAADKPLSFLHVSKAEIDLPPGTDPHDPAVYQRARENFQRLIEQGVLLREAQPCYYVYRLRMGEHEQTGLVAVGSVAAYDANRIRKHEFTRPDKEDDRVRHILALRAQTGPVLLAYRAQADIDRALAQATEADPLYRVEADGVVHTLWRIDDPTAIDALTRRFDALDALYIADGHHRSAAASRVARQIDGDPEHPSRYFLVVAFPHDQMRILDYNRVVRDLNGLDETAFLAAVAERFAVEPAAAAVRPETPGTFGMYLGGRWYRLRIRPEHVPGDDPVAALDVSLLQDHLLGPVLGIQDPRKDPRIDFVGGIRGLAELERRVDRGGMAVAFSLHPTRMEQLMAVADAGRVMPPKSTWFEPKLADGLINHLID
ncbi:MAG: hypothetical protein KatS3mg121_0667 [Gammaproteobacteria bacterium]|nr:MAG: hypothetical protein KatS3mg121_0667 [Gammaproteobacteria bacterium]